MNKQDLAATLAKKLDISQRLANETISVIEEEVIKEVKKGKDVRLVGFGTFKRVRRKARTGVNPQTGKAIKIAAKNVPKFVAGAAFKNKVR